MAAVPATAPLRAPAKEATPRVARPRTRRAARIRLASGVIWIVTLAVLLSGIVALNVAVLGLNVRLDELSHRRADLQAQNASLEGRISQALARTDSLARRQGLIPANPDETRFVNLRPKVK